MKIYKYGFAGILALAAALTLILSSGHAPTAFAQAEAEAADVQVEAAQIRTGQTDVDVPFVGCQASGSIPIFPSAGTTCGTPGGNPGSLAVGQQKDIAITITNT